MRQKRVNQAFMTLASLLRPYFSNRAANMFKKALPIQLRVNKGKSFHLLITIGDLDV